MVLCGVVKVEHTRGRIGAAPEIFQVRLGKKKRDLASEDDQRELFPGELRNRPNQTKAVFYVVLTSISQPWTSWRLAD
jgi:hypothetical protein